MDSGVIFRSIRILCAVYYILCKPDLKIPLEFQWIPMETGRTTCRATIANLGGTLVSENLRMTLD